MMRSCTLLQLAVAAVLLALCSSVLALNTSSEKTIENDVTTTETLSTKLLPDICTTCDKDVEVCSENKTKCECKQGYALVGRKCIEICTTCEDTEKCSDDGTKCECKQGYTRIGKKCTVDCATYGTKNEYICDETKNELTCAKGYKMNDDKKCLVDCDGTCSGVEHVCNETANTCDCAEKYILQEGNCTVDCKQCKGEEHYDCDEDCNTCTCATGYNMAENGTCVVDCYKYSKADHYICDDKDNTIKCQVGYTLESVNMTCQVNCSGECSGDEYLCDAGKNTCECAEGYTRSHDHTCTNCTTNSTCLYGCFLDGECDCPKQYTGPKCDFDLCARCDNNTEVCNPDTHSCDCKPLLFRTKTHPCIVDKNLCTKDKNYILDAKNNTCTCAVGYDMIDDDSCVVDCEGTCSGQAYSCDKVSNTCNCTKLFKKNHAGGCKVDPNLCTKEKHYHLNAKKNTCTCVKGYKMTENDTCADFCDPTCDETSEHCQAGKCSCKKGYERTTEDSKCTKARNHKEEDPAKEEAESLLSSHFLPYFVVAIAVVVCGYVAYHNRQKLMNLAGAGPEKTTKKPRPSSKDYRKLESNVSESLAKGSGKNFIF
ncbi:cell death abnormality protein 1-like [Watersipora subatra]|uniref:cell death abnormality protein 1-like n=1 Tax=Watersipora subatra TaxID=2589382 RepID=UPI00355B8564